MESEQEKKERKDEEARIAIETRKFEIGLFWQRSLFFAGLVAAAFTGVMQIIDKHPLWALSLCSFATVCSLCWVLANRGSKFWQKNWEKKADNATNNYFATVIGEESLSPLEPAMYSVSKLIIAVSHFAWIGWYVITLLLSKKFLVDQRIGDDGKEIVVLIVSVLLFFQIAIAFVTRSGDDVLGKVYRDSENECLQRCSFYRAYLQFRIPFSYLTVLILVPLYFPGGRETLRNISIYHWLLSIYVLFVYIVYCLSNDTLRKKAKEPKPGTTCNSSPNSGTGEGETEGI